MKRLVLPIFLLLGACTTAPTRQPPPVIDGRTGEQAPAAPATPDEAGEPGVIVTPQPPPAAAAATGGAVVALLDQAEDYHRSGDVNNEAATLERALRIESRNAGLWHRLAAVRLDQGRPREAEQLALKSNALAGDNRALQVRNWQLVARARWSLNDSEGARRAEQRAHDLGG